MSKRTLFFSFLRNVQGLPTVLPAFRPWPGLPDPPGAPAGAPRLRLLQPDRGQDHQRVRHRDGAVRHVRTRREVLRTVFVDVHVGSTLAVQSLISRHLNKISCSYICTCTVLTYTLYRGVFPLILLPCDQIGAINYLQTGTTTSIQSDSYPALLRPGPPSGHVFGTDPEMIELISKRLGFQGRVREKAS